MEAKIILRNTMLVSFEGRGYCHMECSSIDLVLLAQNMKLGGEHFKEVEGRYTGLHFIRPINSVQCNRTS